MKKVLIQGVELEYEGVKGHFSSEFRLGTIWPCKAHEHVADHELKCPVCMNTATVAAMAAKLVVEHGWLCGPCIDDMLERGEIQHTQVDFS